MWIAIILLIIFILFIKCTSPTLDLIKRIKDRMEWEERWAQVKKEEQDRINRIKRMEEESETRREMAKMEAEQKKYDNHLLNGPERK